MSAVREPLPSRCQFELPVVGRIDRLASGCLVAAADDLRRTGGVAIGIADDHLGHNFLRLDCCSIGPIQGEAAGGAGAFGGVDHGGFREVLV